MTTDNLFDYYNVDLPISDHPSGFVKEFAKVTGQEPNPDLYKDLITEEYSELIFAIVEGHKDTEILKELADLVYVAFGYALAKGWDLDTAIKRVHENNLGRCLQPDGSILRREDGKILRNQDYPKVKLKDLV